MRPMPLPVSLSVRGRLALVAGAGEVARRKAAALRGAGARVRVVAPEIAEAVREISGSDDVELLQRAYQSDDLNGVFIAIAATSDDAVNAAIVRDARSAGILVCDASNGERGDFTMSATVEIGDLTFAIDTGGSAPAFAKRLAGELREHFGETYAAAAETLRRMRSYVKSEFPHEERAGVLADMAQLPVLELASKNVEAVVCATRASALATVQARAVAAKLARRGIATTFLNVTTTGDRIRDRSLAEIGTENIFVKELETALRDKRAAYAVHSCKDLASTLPPDMEIVAVSAREDPRDVLCSERFERFEDLPPGARVGTSSTRRRAQLRALRDDLVYLDLRGNVDTRLQKLRGGAYEAIVLASAGLRRLGTSAAFSTPFDVTQIVPAAGQGALAVEMLRGESALEKELREAVSDPSAELEVRCERAALRDLRGGCQAPIGIHARHENGRLRALGAVAAPDGSRLLRAEISGACASAEDAEAIGVQLAAALDAQGSGLLLAPLSGKLILVARTRAEPSRIGAALAAQGAEVAEIHGGEGDPPGLRGRTPDLLIFPSSGSVAAAASYLATMRDVRPRPAVAAMGPQSASAAAAEGFEADLVAEDASVSQLVEAVAKHFSSKERLRG